MIIGVDFGSHAAVAVVDLEGNPVALKSWKNAAFGEMVSFCSGYEIAFVACDKRVPPRQARRLNACFNAKLYRPERDLTVFEKLRLTRGGNAANEHERDALAAALKCYHSRFANQSRKISKRVPAALRREAKLFVARGRRLSDFLRQPNPLKSRFP